MELIRHISHTQLSYVASMISHSSRLNTIIVLFANGIDAYVYYIITILDILRYAFKDMSVYMYAHTYIHTRAYTQSHVLIHSRLSRDYNRKILTIHICICIKKLYTKCLRNLWHFFSLYKYLFGDRFR